jgi:hypothetical protein
MTVRGWEGSRGKTGDFFGRAVGDSLYICCAVHSGGLSATVYFDREACSDEDRVRATAGMVPLVALAE